MRYLLMKISVLRYLLSENRYLLWNFGTPLHDAKQGSNWLAVLWAEKLGHEDIIGQNTSLHNIYSIFICKLQMVCYENAMHKVFPLNSLGNSVKFDRWTNSVGQVVPPPHLVFSLDLYWSQWPPRSASPGAEFRQWAEKLDPCAKDEGRRSNGSAVRAQTNGQTDARTNATKCIISLASRSIIT